MSRYLQLTALVFAAGVIYPLVYLRQNFEGSMLEAFNITNTQLGQCYSMLGVLFVATYLPSGWLADKVSPRVLMTFSLAGTGLLGLWFWTLPSFTELRIIYALWGITTGLTFWAALIKETNLIAGENEQGRFFGILEGGRGVVEALLASLAVAWFAFALSRADATTPDALREVILIYTAALLTMAPVIWLTLGDVPGAEPESGGSGHSLSDTLFATRLIFSQVEVWLASLCILCGYALFYATYSFAGYLENELQMSAVMAGWVTLGRQWMRPFGGVLAGFIGDRYRVDRVLCILLAASGIGLSLVVFLPVGGSVVIVLGVVLTVSLLTYAVRGIYWGTLADCDVPVHMKGLAIGVMSLIGYSPEIWVPLMNGYLVDAFPGRTGYALYFGSIAPLGFVGAAAAWGLVRRVNQRGVAHPA